MSLFALLLATLLWPLLVGLGAAWVRRWHERQVEGGLVERLRGRGIL